MQIYKKSDTEYFVINGNRCVKYIFSSDTEVKIKLKARKPKNINSLQKVDKSELEDKLQLKMF